MWALFSTASCCCVLKCPNWPRSFITCSDVVLRLTYGVSRGLVSVKRNGILIIIIIIILKFRAFLSAGLAGNLGRLTWVRHNAAAAIAVLPTEYSYRCMQYFHVSKQCYGCQCLGFLTCVQMLIHAIAHGGCTNTVRESALKVGSGRKILCRTWDSNPCQYCALLTSFCALLTMIFIHEECSGEDRYNSYIGEDRYNS